MVSVHRAESRALGLDFELYRCIVQAYNTKQGVAMGSSSDSEQTRALLIQAAGGLFAERGYSGVTARQVVAQAGVSLGAIPYHFGSMEELYRETLLEACKSTQDTRVLVDLVDREEPREALRLAVIWALEEYSATEVSWQIKLIEREFLDPSKSFLSVIQRKLRPEWDLLCKIVGRAVDQSPDSDAVAFGVITMHTLASTFLTHRRFIQELAPTLVHDTNRLDALSQVLTSLTMEAVCHYGEQFSHASGKGRKRTTLQARTPSKEQGRGRKRS
jgi:AcrR family transcriptional regulator